jgi:hypothetical protein
MRKPSKNDTPQQKQLLIPREQARHNYLGGYSIATCIRLEKRGVLTPIKLNRARNGKVFYAHDNLVAVAQGND